MLTGFDMDETDEFEKVGDLVALSYLVQWRRSTQTRLWYKHASLRMTRGGLKLNLGNHVVDLREPRPVCEGHFHRLFGKAAHTVSGFLLRAVQRLLAGLPPVCCSLSCAAYGSVAVVGVAIIVVNGGGNSISR
ncbi:hypothetical protein NEUTE2DRAFT_142364 [Neurospora tetrasperma FGSC 2509]|nr:hypothetical protein NEUTE2DRAFT_142364 [Neurospora tetrasperma FGSC 2509]